LFALSFEAARFGLEMQSVVALRLMRLMGGSKARGSVSEKMAARTEPQTSATTVSINNGTDPKVGKTAPNVYKKRGRANKRRLSNRTHRKSAAGRSAVPTSTGRAGVSAHKRG
jgi:hypothetical protein